MVPHISKNQFQNISEIDFPIKFAENFLVYRHCVEYVLEYR